METGLAHQLAIAAAMPQRQWLDTHQRAVAEGALLAGAGIEHGDTGAQTQERLTGLDADSEDHAVHGMVAIVVPP
jgi:hypothetical protein